MDIVTNDYIQNKYRENLFYFHPLSKWEDAVVLALASYKCGVAVQPVVEINQSSPSLDGEGWDGVINLVEGSPSLTGLALPIQIWKGGVKHA